MSRIALLSSTVRTVFVMTSPGSAVVGKGRRGMAAEPGKGTARHQGFPCGDDQLQGEGRGPPFRQVELQRGIRQNTGDAVAQSRQKGRGRGSVALCRKDQDGVAILVRVLSAQVQASVSSSLQPQRHLAGPALDRRRLMHRQFPADFLRPASDVGPGAAHPRDVYDWVTDFGQEAVGAKSEAGLRMEAPPGLNRNAQAAASAFACLAERLSDVRGAMTDLEERLRDLTSV